ncbi:homogentisate 1,2-dioxygenase [Novosphingobium sp. 1949]|uniref:Homogentisate 1,2-dioxygenase n=2 Tax=Novosphingobium organovorum TaxID=2930092 RepID=A0ABT0B7Q3_9SPHN|nr:homogentisate 1,2-dioxygenase [Novosphingobium organovorum]
MANAALRGGCLAGLGLLVLAAVPASAQKEAPASECASSSPALAPEFASWTGRGGLSAAASLAGVGAAQLQPGRAVEAGLLPTPQVHYALRPEKPGGTVSHGGLFRFHVAAAGTYRVALGSAAWIDVVKDGKGLVSTAHGHGPDCSGIRKIVDFTLVPGDYLLQVSANAETSTGLLVTRKP